MKSLVAFAKNIFRNTSCKQRTRARSGRFAMESLETRVLLSADPVALPDLIDQPEPTAEEHTVLPWEDTRADNTDADTGGEGEEEEGGDFIEHEAYEEAYGPFDYDVFVEDEANGPLGGQGGAVDSSPESSSVLANNNAGATGTSNYTQSETSVIAFDNTVLIAFNDSGSVSGGTNKFTGFARSTDGGITFTDGGVLPTNSVGDLGDPVLARNNTTGRLYFATLQFSGSGIAVFHSDDGGVTWSAPAQGAPGKTDFQDKEWIAVDNFAGSGNGNVYVAERDFGPGNGIYFFRSTDNGTTFGPTGGTLIASGNQGAFVTVGPDHSVYVFWWAGSTIQMRKSTNQGLSFAPAVTVASLVGGTNGDLALTGVRQGTDTAAGFRSNEFPQAVVNPVNGNIYVTYSNDGPGVDRADVFVVQSTNGGATWSAPIAMDDNGTITDQWQPTLAVTPAGNKLGIFYYSRQEDPAGNNLFKYYGSIANISGSTLSFGPVFPISDTPSLPEFGRDVLVNPTYMGDYDAAYATPGFFHVSWSDSRSDLPNGEGRKDPNVYYKAIDLGLTVLTTTPGDDSVVSSILLDYVVNFSDPIQAATIDATDFTVDGVSADSFMVSTSTQVKFHFNGAPFSTEGLHTIAMSDGSILRLSDGDSLQAFSSAFRYDANPLQVTSTVPSVGGVFTLPGPFTYDVTFDVNFNEAIDPTSVQTWDLVLDGMDDAFVSAATVLPGNMTARFSLSGITQGLLTANIMAGAISDASGNPGTAFSSSSAYSADVDTVSYPTPLTAEEPDGSLIYDPSLTGFISFENDVDSYTLNVDLGQTISLVLTPTSPGLRPRIELLDTNGISQGIAVAPAAGQIAAIETSPANIGGVYTFAVSGVGGTTGGYTLQVILNSAFEREGKVAGSTNNTLSLSTSGGVATINAADSGWIVSDGTHDAGNNNYFAGQTSIASQSRDYFTFTLPVSTPTITGAELRLFNPLNGYTSSDPTETYTLFDVSTTPVVLDATRAAGDATGIGIYDDLGSGTVYGSRVVSATDNNKTVAIALNADAVAALNAAIGSTISLGGAITTLAGTSSQWMFGFTSGALGTVQLILQTAGVSMAENIDSSFLTVSTPQASAERGAVLGQTDFSSNYTVTSMPFTFEDISTTGTVITSLTNQDNIAVGIFPSGFLFPFYGVNNTTVFVSSNGLLTFGSGNSSSDNTNLTVSPSQPAIAPFWDDLHTGGGVSGSNVFYQVIGAGPNRHLTIQWNKVRFASGGTAGDTLTFEAQLFMNGRIRFNYLDLVSGPAAGNNGASATVGSKAAGTQDPNRVLLSFNNGSSTFVGTGKSTLLTPGVPTPDYYAFTLNEGETASLAATVMGPGNPNFTLELRDSSDAVLATGTATAPTLPKVISDFAVLTGGTYYARVTGNNGAISTPYSLVVTRNAAFETELNNTPDTAQTLVGSQEGVLGALFAQIPINAMDSGWVATDGTHTATNNSYFVGQSSFNNNPLSEFRNYATFALSAATPTIIGAELWLFNPGPPTLPAGYTSPDLTETYTLFDVSPATQADLDVTRGAGDTRGMAIHNDLGSGTVYGTRVVSAADNNTAVVIPLNDAAVAALNAAVGSTISFGGAITTLTGSAQQTMFAFTNGARGSVRLVLQTPAHDWYSITLPDTANAVRLETSTPGDGAGEPLNTLNPTIELYDSTGTTLVASGATAPDGRNESIVATGLTPGATYKVHLTSEGDTAGEYFLTRNFDFSPVLTDVAVASAINENDTATLTGSFNDLDPLDSHTVVITWGPGEGSTTLNLAAGVLTFGAAHQYYDDNPTSTDSNVYSISVTVTDNHFGSDSESLNLTVNNVAPDVSLSGPSSGVRGQALDFSGSFTDVGTLDTHEVRWDFGDGTVIDFHPTTDPNALTPSAHVYTDNGVYTLTLSIRDDDTGLTSVNKTVTITSVAMQADPCDSIKTALVVGGTTGNDTIVFNPSGNLGDIEVSINGISQGVFHPTGRIIVYGQAGDDDIQTAGSIALDAWLFGDAGNDHLKGGAGFTLLVGGDGDDELLGGKGRSILIGGRGKDRLVGGSGEDILIGGFTSYDSNVLFCCNVTDGWKSIVDTYAVRVGRLRLLLNDDTVIDDGEADRLTGSSSLDWFFDSLTDVITDEHTGELVEAG